MGVGIAAGAAGASLPPTASTPALGDDGEGLCKVGSYMGTPESPWSGMRCGTPIAGGWRVAELGGGTGGGSRVLQQRWQEGTGSGDLGCFRCCCEASENGASRLAGWQQVGKGRCSAPGPQSHLHCRHPKEKPFLGAEDTQGDGVWPDRNRVSCEIAVPISLPPSAASFPPSRCCGGAVEPPGGRELGDPLALTHPNHIP